ncbi:MAG: DUF4325 domain-containing protein [Deltaproteobacteria bacterium]|nr:DUF4325 domain-containing protein [Deltaproteobacteria bacterium]
MQIDLGKFGDLLISRPAGREAALVVRAYFKPQHAQEPIELDFTAVLVLAPSWLDEFLQGLRTYCENPVRCLPSTNPTVIASLKTLQLGP